MDQSFAAILGKLAAIPDPVKRFDEARTTGATIAAIFASAENDALRALLAAHGGSHKAAAAEIGFTRQALEKRLARPDPAAAPAPAAVPAAVQCEPALRFEDEADAEDGLREWQDRQQGVDDQREPYLLGALAVGVDPVRVSELSGAPLPLLRRIRPPGNITVSCIGAYAPDIDLLDAFAVAAHHHAEHLAQPEQAEPFHRALAVTWRTAAAEIVRNVAPLALMSPTPPVEDYPDADSWIAAGDEHAAAHPEDFKDPDPQDDVAIHSSDAWLAATTARYRRLADEARARGPLPGPKNDPGADRSWHNGFVTAYEQVADAIHHLRTTGTVPDLSTLDAK